MYSAAPELVLNEHGFDHVLVQNKSTPRFELGTFCE